MLNRRKFIRRMILTTGGIIAANAQGKTASAADPDLPYSIYLPQVQKAEPSTPTPPPATGSARVIHVHADHATNWNFSSGWYGDYVNQSVVDAMCETGVKNVTGQSTLAAAWQALLPGYSQGKKIAIKVNFNNHWNGCTIGTEDAIDGLIHPVKGLIKGMKQAGVQENDIWIYDATRYLPTRFTSVGKDPYSNIHFFDSACNEDATFNSTRTDATVSFSPPGGSAFSVKLTDVVVNAAYLINVCILKGHPAGGISHGFKNHLGSLPSDQPSLLHSTLDFTKGTYSPTYSPLVILNSNTHIKDKTVLTVGDGLFGAANINSKPEPWSNFDNKSPNSLFFSTDRVAIDTVMADTFRAQFGLDERAYDYMQLAHNAGLGQYHSIRSGPYPSGYYVKIEV
jgi:hypothetical protein